MNNEKIYKMKFSKVYPLLVQKAERKNRTKEEVDEIITWLTGYSEDELKSQLERDLDYEEFFNEAPKFLLNLLGDLKFLLSILYFQNRY